ncbi:MAG TPA: hypothetical protein VHA06_10070 [Candidatus Angelobacter sp.]|nr:hypothetical protein [Candidatus Angelobacter sp.]
MKTHSTTISGFLLIAGFAFGAFAGTASKSDVSLRSAMPAGYDVMVLKPSGNILSFMALIECPELEGAKHVSTGANAKLVSASGRTIQNFPQRFSFRVTASLRKILLDGPVTSVNFPHDPHELLLKLKFRVRDYHGLESREIIPESVEMIGMPADVPYDERVYRVNMNVGHLPVSDRLVIDVLSPQGERLTHFPFILL